MLNLAQLLMHEAPPKPKGGVLVRPMGADPVEEGESAYTCIACGHRGGAEDFYWRKRNNGSMDRLKKCKACHKSTVARCAALRAEK